MEKYEMTPYEEFNLQERTKDIFTKEFLQTLRLKAVHTDIKLMWTLNRPCFNPNHLGTWFHYAQGNYNDEEEENRRRKAEAKRFVHKMKEGQEMLALKLSIAKELEMEEEERDFKLLML